MCSLNDDQRVFAEQVRKMVTDRVRPRAAEIDRTTQFPWDLKEVFQEMGLMPEAYGGCYQGHLYVCLAVEEIARACVSSSLIVQVQSLGYHPILIGGSEEQKKKYGPSSVASGQSLTAYGLTEPGAGSDAAAMMTKAVKHGDKYLINGSKCFISNGPIADVLSLFAMTDSSKGVRGISAFIVEKSYPGYGVAKCESKMGIKSSSSRGNLQNSHLHLFFRK